MFSRIKGAIDRSLAEEQARHRASTERAASNNANASTGNTTGLPLRQADPAVFEDAFKIDDEDSDATSRAATPKTNTDDSNSEKKSSPLKADQNTDAKKVAENGSEAAEKPAESSPAASSLPPQVSARLKRLEKLETTYKDLLRSYRIAHSRAVSIEPFERALRENTPLHSIADPAALVEYINQLNLKSDMVLGELKRVSAEKDGIKKKADEVDKELAELKSKKDASQPADADNNATQAAEAKKGDVAEKGNGEDLFSYDDSMTEQVATLNSQIAALKIELDAAHESEKARKSKEQELLISEKIAQAAEIKSLEEVIASFKEEIKGLEDTKLAYEREICAKNDRLSEENASLRDEIETLKKTHAKSGAAPSAATPSVPAPSVANPSQSKSAKKKNKNKKKKTAGGSEATMEEPEISQPPPPEIQPEIQPEHQADSPDVEALMAQIAKLQEEIAQGQASIKMSTTKLNATESALKDSDDLEKRLSDALESSNESRALIEKLESENAAFQSRIPELEKELALSTAQAESSAKQSAEFESIKGKYDESKIKVRTLESDLGALEKIAQDRWKEIVGYKDLLSKIQPELKTLRQVSATVKETEQSHASLQNELRAIEKREKDLKKEIASVSRLASDRESEIKLINDRFTAEKTLRTKVEEEKRKLNSSNQRLEGEKNQISAEADKTVRRLETAQSELSTLRPKITKLENEVTKLQREKNLAKEDVDLKTQQYNSAQSLLASMRDQSTELSTRLKEAQSQVESLEEELAESQKHLAERTREAETMRRMLADVNERTDAKVREMKSQMEAAVEERDRIEDESSTLARRYSRENGELKDSVRELEREIKDLRSEKDQLEVREREWNERRLQLEQVEEKAAVEVEEIRAVMSNLRSALDASEQQVQDAEKQKADLRKLLEEARSRYEKVNKELKSVQSKLIPGSGSSIASGGRPSTDSTRSSTGPAARGSPADIQYLKTIFLQFLEVRDDKVRSQLVPVLSRLLGFDKNEDQRWLQAIQRMSKSGK